MLEMVALLTLIERCAPDAPVKALVTAARVASGFEPLVLATRQNGRALSVQALSRPEAIALAAEMKVAGQPVRLGLLGVDAREFDRRGLSLSEAFDSCTNLHVAGELLARDPTALTTKPDPVRRPRPPAEAAARAVTGDDPSSNIPVLDRPTAGPTPPRAWDVYGRTRAAAVLVYGDLK